MLERWYENLVIFCQVVDEKAVYVVADIDENRLNIE